MSLFYFIYYFIYYLFLFIINFFTFGTLFLFSWCLFNIHIISSACVECTDALTILNEKHHAKKCFEIEIGRE